MGRAFRQPVSTGIIPQPTAACDSHIAEGAGTPTLTIREAECLESNEGWRASPDIARSIAALAG